MVSGNLLRYRISLLVLVLLLFEVGLCFKGTVAAYAATSDKWSRNYGGLDYEYAKAVVQMSDGGYAFAGYIITLSPPDDDAWLVRIDSNGNMMWNRTFGGSSNDMAYALVKTSDGGFAFAGHTASYSSNQVVQLWLAKTDSEGTMLWNKTYGDDAEAFALLQTGDGGYAVAGRFGQADAWLIKTDLNGNVEWNKTYGGMQMDLASALTLTNDGGYALAGVTYSYSQSVSDSWLVRTDANGNPLWNKTYGGSGDDHAYALANTSDGGYAIGCYTYSSLSTHGDFYLIKTDANGTVEWDKVYYSTGDDYLASIVQCSDLGYALAGRRGGSGLNYGDFWLIKTDTVGNALWNKTYGGERDDWAYSMVQTSDGGYAIAGETRSFGEGDADAFLVKTDGNGETVIIPEYSSQIVLMVLTTLTFLVAVWKRAKRTTKPQNRRC